MKSMTEEKAVRQMERYEHARKQEDGWKRAREEADKKLKEFVNRKYASVVTRKIKSLCELHSVSAARFWGMEGTHVYPSVDHSTSPWTVSAWAKVEVMLYIHEDKEVARDQLTIEFNVSEIDKALSRLGRMMAAGIGAE